MKKTDTSPAKKRSDLTSPESVEALAKSLDHFQDYNNVPERAAAALRALSAELEEARQFYADANRKFDELHEELSLLRAEHEAVKWRQSASTQISRWNANAELNEKYAAVETFYRERGDG